MKNEEGRRERPRGAARDRGPGRLRRRARETAASGGDGGEETPAALDFLPCIVSDAGGFDDKSFNQLSYEGVEQAADELGVEFKAVESNSENDYAPNLESLVGRGLRRHRDRGLRARVRDQGVGRGQPRHQVHPHRRRRRRWRRRQTFDGKADAAEHQAAALRHRPGGVPGRLRRGRLHQDRRRRHLRRPAVPDRDDLHGRLQAGRRVLRQGEGQGRQGRRLGRQGRLCSPVASRPTRRPPTPPASSSTRTST